MHVYMYIIHVCVHCIYVLSSYSLPLPLISDEPTLPELLRLKVPQSVGALYFMFGTLLLDDKTGRRVDSIKAECLGSPVASAWKILQEWLEGNGLPVTWQSLIQTLRDSDLSALADQIQAAKL